MARDKFPNPVRVCSFESRRADEIRTLIERHGGQATVAPSMREVPIENNVEAFQFAQRLLDGQIDVVVFMTGVGARTLLNAVESQFDRDRFFEALGRTLVIVRGPKPTAVLRDWNVPIDHRAPEPNTWRELLNVIDKHVPVDGKQVAVQEYGQSNDAFYKGLEQRGAQVLPVPVYLWEFPQDTRPMRSAIRDTIDGRFDLLMWTSANQVSNVLRAADEEGVREAWRAAAAKCVIASVGPTCTEKLNAEGLPVHVEASPPKMGVLVRDALGFTRSERRSGP